AVLARGQLDEGADGDDADDLAVVEVADFGLEDDVLDGLARGAAGLDVLGGDVDVAGVLDVDLAAGVGADLLDDLAAGADDLADLVRVYRRLDHLRRGLGQLLARLADAGEHDLVEDLDARLVGDLKRFLDYLMLQAVVLAVHLDGGDALLGAGDLEVHLAVEVLDALDVDEGGEVVAVLDEAAGDAGDGGLDGHARVHEGEGAAADGALGGGAVGGEHLAHHADGVGEVLNGGNDGLQGLLGQGAVA